MDNEAEVIHQQIEETRSALQNKLETLEEQVKCTVQDATEAVSETVETVKGAVQDTVETVKGTVEETVQSVKKTFDLPGHVQEHPWTMFLGAAAVGFLGTRWLTRAASLPRPWAAARRTSAPITPYRATNPHPGNGVAASAPSAAPQETTSAAPKESWLAEHYQEELAKIKGLAVGVIGGLVREMLTASVSPTLVEPIKDVVNGITVKMGGRLIEGPILRPSEPDAAPKQRTPEGYPESLYAS